MTTLVRFPEPLRDIAVNGEFERLVKTVFDSSARAAALSHAWTPPLDVWETEGELVYAFDLPGIPEEKIAVELEESTLTVSGSRDRAELLEEGRFFRYERPFGEFMRSVALPEGTGDGEARAHYTNGVLEVTVQKPAHSTPRSIAVTTTVESPSTN